MKKMFKRASGRRKVAVLAAVVALALVVASPALAKTANTVKETLSYVGSLSTPILQITNEGSGPGLSINVRKEKAPLTVSRGAGTATGLSADMLDGKDSTEFVSGVDSESDYTAVGLSDPGISEVFTNIRSITVTAPADGYVVLTGDGTFVSQHDNPEEITQALVFLGTVSETEDFARKTQSVIPANAPLGEYRTPFSLTEVFPVKAGENTFYMTGSSYKAKVRVQDSSLTGVFIKNQL